MYEHWASIHLCSLICCCLQLVCCCYCWRWCWCWCFVFVMFYLQVIFISVVVAIFWRRFNNVFIFHPDAKRSFLHSLFLLPLRSVVLCLWRSSNALPSNIVFLLAYFSVVVVVGFYWHSSSSSNASVNALLNKQIMARRDNAMCNPCNGYSIW